MIIADQQSWRKRITKHLKWLIASAGVIAVLSYFSYPIVLLYSTYTEPGVLNFDAEHRWRKSFISNGQFFSRGHHQSDEAARSGIYSNKVAAGKTMQYGISGTFKNINPGKHYVASVWYKPEKESGLAGLVVQGATVEQFYQSTEKPVIEEAGWKKLQLEIDIPGKFPSSEMSIYVYTNGTCTVYFDDMRMEEMEAKTETVNEAKANTTVQFVAPKLQLQIKEKAMAILQAKRDDAFEKSILITDEDSWVKAILSDDGEEIPVKIRLKGDWTDHLAKDRWSFRVQVKDPYSWNRLIVFSLQSPETRYYADEWLLHRFFEREDVLTTRYDFIQLSINGKSLGAYAYEEHFDKQLLEYKSRREGPILRLSEDAMWAVRLLNVEEGYSENHPAIAQSEQAEIQPFKESRTAENPKLREDFEIARHLLYQYQQGLKSAADIFDLERLGRYFAICDVMGSAHGLNWHNQRFYYNPVISKLEPIGFDGYGYEPVFEPYLLGHGLIESSRPEYVAALKNLVEDLDFLEHYLPCLEKYSSVEYLDTLFLDLEESLQDRVAFLNQNFPKYNYNKRKLYERAKAIRSKLHPFNDYSVKAYWRQDKKQNPEVLVLRNFHEMPLMIVGASAVKDRMQYPLDKAFFMPAYYYRYPAKEAELKVPADSRYIFYKSYSQGEIYTTEISRWSANLQPIPAQEYQSQTPLVSNEIFSVEGAIIRFNSGVFVLTDDLIIPSGHQVFLHAGTQLDFQKGAKFLSYSPINIQGTSETPVRIVSTDHSAHGFTVLQAGETSQLNYVIFDHFNTLIDRGWQLTGAVTFYESDVNMSNCIFENNHCEDGLNLIRSRFMMEGVTVRNTPFDGFDADFCEGTIRHSFFNDTGNDGVDVSGSKIKVIDCQMNRNGDKGISVGENSQMEIKSTAVNGAVIGVASKDLSHVRIEQIILKNCNQGFAAYQKKPEYGPSIIDVKDYEAEKVKYLYTIAPGSKLYLGGKSTVGKR